MKQGIYEELVTQLVLKKINELNRDTYYINTSKIDKEEASIIISRHLSRTIKEVLDGLKGENQIEQQIVIANKIIGFLKDELALHDFDKDLIESDGEILKAVFSRLDDHSPESDPDLKEITPYTRLSYSELFTGGSNSGLSLETELKKEILSSNRIDLLVSFIKFKGIIILERELQEFAKRGGQLRVITTTYMGASDYKAILLLSRLANTTVKISYNTGNERLHAKAYLFYRNTGFHTGYIGSSNFSRSALTDGLEWNVKITTKEVGHIIDKFQKTFDSYWQSDDFEEFDETIHKEKLISALQQGRTSHSGAIAPASFFDITPHHFQLEILEKLEVERTTHNRHRNLVVAATGTGKTVISAFDFNKFKKSNPAARLLFLAHRKEILEQALSTFRGILKDNNFGELWVDGLNPTDIDHVFASVQTLNNRLDQIEIPPNHYDFIVIDECHHLTASSYRGIIQYFTPKILLGLTATPERMDGSDIKEDFHQRIAAEIRLPEALNRKLLCPFQYFGITDSVDLSNVKWEKGRYVISELSRVYTGNDRRVRDILLALDKYTKEYTDVRALGFCVNIEHAKFMADKFNAAGLKANYLVSSNASERAQIRHEFKNKEINYLFVVDIFNEGVDIPEIDTVLFLRPTESLTIFLQQLGRGLRLAEGKECLTVLDFVGNSRPEYNFENKFRALVGKTNTPIKKEIEANFPFLPLGCSIILERRCKEIILNNIKNATSFNINQLVQKIQTFENQTALPLSLKNFVEFYGIPLPLIYKNMRQLGWKRMCNMAGKIPDFSSENQGPLFSAIQNKWLSTASSRYFNFILTLARKRFDINLNTFSAKEKQMAVMLYYDFWREPGRFPDLESSIRAIGKNEVLVDEIIDLIELLIDQVDFKEIDIELPYSQPLMLHARYTRDQILAAFGLSTFNKKSSNREGVAEIEALNTELLFINLIKSAEDYSPTTMYDDYAISDRLFHWQSQNSAGPETPKGLSYIRHKETGKKIMLFVREKSNDEFGNTMGYVFLGEGEIQHYYGSKPMSIEWLLKEPMPHFLWKDAVKLRAS